MIVEIGYGSILHNCTTDDVMKAGGAEGTKILSWAS